MLLYDFSLKNLPNYRYVIHIQSRILSKYHVLIRKKIWKDNAIITTGFTMVPVVAPATRGFSGRSPKEFEIFRYFSYYCDTTKIFRDALLWNPASTPAYYFE